MASSELSGVVLLAAVADAGPAELAGAGPQAASDAAISAPPAVAAKTARRECRSRNRNLIPTPPL
jgi:hypothetical protein